MRESFVRESNRPGFICRGLRRDAAKFVATRQDADIQEYQVSFKGGLNGPKVTRRIPTLPNYADPFRLMPFVLDAKQCSGPACRSRRHVIQEM
jgi:hypothetical protein